MKLSLVRDTHLSTSTSGILYVNEQFECYTLEDCDRLDTPKVYGETCIPAGTYNIQFAPSKHFGRMMPHIMNVPGFEGILMHWGDRTKDTLGCVLVGRKRFIPDESEEKEATLSDSRLAFAKLFNDIHMALAMNESVTIEITDQW